MPRTPHGHANVRLAPELTSCQARRDTVRPWHRETAHQTCRSSSWGSTRDRSPEQRDRERSALGRSAVLRTERSHAPGRRFGSVAQLFPRARWGPGDVVRDRMWGSNQFPAKSPPTHPHLRSAVRSSDPSDSHRPERCDQRCTAMQSPPPIRVVGHSNCVSPVGGSPRRGIRSRSRCPSTVELVSVASAVAARVLVAPPIGRAGRRVG